MPQLTRRLTRFRRVLRLRFRRALRWIQGHAWLSIAMAVVLIASLLTGVVFWPDERRAPQLDPLPVEKSVPATKVKPGKPQPDLEAESAITEVEAPTWPQKTKQTVSLGPNSVSVPDTPITLALKKRDGGGDNASPKVTVEVLDRKSIRGPVVRVHRADGKKSPLDVVITMNYNDFSQAYGADWATRLRMISLPHCAWKGTKKADCPAPTTIADNTNNARKHTLSGTLTVTDKPELFAVSAAPSASSGNFTATALSPSATWSAGGNSGAFTWEYGIKLPPVPGQQVPDLALEYSSASVDGRVSSTNNQASWLGEGFEFWPGYIERSYQTCADDTTGAGNPATNDLCFKSDNATMMLGNSGGELVRDDATGVWKLKNDDGSRIEKLTGAVNGDNNGEHWRLTTSDGTQYFFGLNRLPGFSDGKPTTNSAWTVPVFGNHTDEPCKQGSFDTSWCQQGWRWNLDYVVDVHGNAYSVYYTPETNKYGRQGNANNATDYVRGGTVDRIEYGLYGGDAYRPAPAKARFETTNRCVGACDTNNPKDWPDTPWDQHCGTAPCVDKPSPTFWTTKKLSKIVTEVNAGSGFTTVDSWSFRHSLPDAGDGTTPALWLDGITRTGHVGGTLTLPEITFEGWQMDNRVEQLDGPPPLIKRRVSVITNETGSKIGVVYSPQDCTRDTLPSIDGNTTRCYPSYWTPWGATQPKLDWFHKYVATQVTEADLTGGSASEFTYYDYLDGAAWTRDTSEFTLDKHRTTNQFRGYARVRTISGENATVTQSMTETRYLRGLGGAVADSEGAPVNDHTATAGMAYEHTTFNGPSGEVVESETTIPHVRGPLATRNHSGGTVQSFDVDTSEVRARTALADGGWQRSTVASSFDADGNVIEVSDAGDTALSGDEQCTRAWYAPNNDGVWLRGLAQRSQKTAGMCAGSGPVLSEVRSLYDGGEYGAMPTKGLVTRSEELAEGGRYVPSAQTTFDEHGRATTTTDALGRSTTVAFTPVLGGPVTSVVTTNPAGHTETMRPEPARGLTLSSTDANNKTVTMEYDPLGRLTKGWDTDRPQASNTVPTVEFGYMVRRDGANVVTTKTLNSFGGQITSQELYDSRLRPRQTQSPAPGGGRVVTDTYYDTRGLPWKHNGNWFNSSEPGTDLVQAHDNTVTAQAITEYDGAERPTASVFLSKNIEKWRTTTAYGGNWTATTPPDGETATRLYTDIEDNIVEKREYHGATPDGNYDATQYRYDDLNRLSSIVDAVGNAWSYEYDLLGRQIRATDPDKGETRTSYDDVDQISTVTDARGITLGYIYDDLGRRTSARDGAVDGPKRSEWVYDTLAKGELTSATRFHNGAAYSHVVTGYDDGYRVTGEKTVIPTAEGALAGEYASTTQYNVDGSILRHNLPAVGGLAAEGLNYQYSTLGLVTKINSLMDRYGSEPVYSKYGELERLTIGKTYDRVWRTWYREEDTRRVDRVKTDREYQSQVVPITDTSYTLDPAGNITSTSEAVAGDRQCFDYDHLRRMTQAWTAGTQACSAPSASTITGPDPYWLSYSLDAIGNRQSETKHGFGAQAGNDTVSQHSYDASGVRPHAVTRVDRTSTQLAAAQAESAEEPVSPSPSPALSPPNVSASPPSPSPSKPPATVPSASASAAPSVPPSVETSQASGGAGTDETPGAESAELTTTSFDEFSYDNAGNMLTRSVNGAGQNLTWDAEGKLESLTAGTATTSFIYGPDGDRLIKRDGTSATLYLGNTELKLTISSGTVVGTRLYYFDGHLVSSRTGNVATRVLTDHVGSGDTTVNMTTRVVTQRRFMPFGAPRGNTTPHQADAWPANRGFVGGNVDTALGLTHLGAREYDPVIGKFLSVDPIIDPLSSQQLNAYAYGNNSPITFSDPDGLKFKCGWCEKATKKIKKTFKKATKVTKRFIKKNAGTIIAVGVGIAVTSGCLAITAGAGSVACAALGGAAGSAAGYLYDTKASKKRKFSWKGLAVESAFGGATGMIGGKVGAVVGKRVGAALAKRAATKQATKTTATQTATGKATPPTGTAKPAPQAKPADTAAPKQSIRQSGDSTEPSLARKGPKPNEEPRNIPEQLAMESAKQGYGTPIMGEMGDAPRLNAVYGHGQWRKMQNVTRGSSGNVTIHWFRNTDIGADVEFKFVSRYKRFQ